MLQRQHVWTQTGGYLLGQGIVVGSLQRAVQDACDLRYPIVVEVVKYASIDPSPVVNRHRWFPARAPGISFARLFSLTFKAQRLFLKDVLPPESTPFSFPLKGVSHESYFEKQLQAARLR